MDNKTIYEVISKLGKGTIALLEFKPFYSPLELSKHLRYLDASGFAKIDWEKKEIEISNFHESKLVSERNNINRLRTIPESFEVEKIEKNKPTLNFKRED